MTKRQPITPDMKLDCLLYRHSITCGICGAELFPNDKIEWDHVHALVHGGAHVFTNIRPVHVECHKEKTARDIAAKAKGDRLLGLTCNGPKKKIGNRGFDKTLTRKFSGETVKRSSPHPYGESE
jgi:5-methylcytosine-specific restriction endonuclease McrA